MYLAFPMQALPNVTETSGIIDGISHQTNGYTQSTACNANQVQVATQTQAPATTAATIVASDKKQVYTAPATGKGKKGRYPLLTQQQSCQQQQTANTQQQTPNFTSQNYQLDPTAGKRILAPPPALFLIYL